jgi:hypothetical protein
MTVPTMRTVGSFNRVCLATNQARSARERKKPSKFARGPSALRARRAFCAAPSVIGDRCDSRVRRISGALHARSLKMQERTHRARANEARSSGLPERNHWRGRGPSAHATCDNEPTAVARIGIRANVENEPTLMNPALRFGENEPTAERCKGTSGFATDL